MSPPKDDKSMPSRFIGLLFGSGDLSSLPFSFCTFELMVSPVGLGFDCRGIAPVCMRFTGDTAFHKLPFQPLTHHAGRKHDRGVRRACDEASFMRGAVSACGLQHQTRESGGDCASLQDNVE